MSDILYFSWGLPSSRDTEGYKQEELNMWSHESLLRAQWALKEEEVVDSTWDLRKDFIASLFSLQIVS